MGRYTHARVDVNQAEIVQALRGVGATIRHTHALRDGGGDILAGFRGVNYLLEIKPPGPPHMQKLSDKEARFVREWGGHHAIVKDKDEALRAIGIKP